MLHHYIEHKRLDELCDAAPQLIFLALTPYLGPEARRQTSRRAALARGAS